MASKIPRTRNCGRWTEAQFRSFIRSLLRRGSVRWSPRAKIVSDAFVENGVNPDTGRRCKLHRCSSCSALVAKKDMVADHIIPVVDPVMGFTNWDDFIHRLFCEMDNLQAICKVCHAAKTKDERAVRTKSKAIRKRKLNAVQNK